MGSRSTMMERSSTPSALAWVMAQRRSEGTKRDSVSCSPMRSMKWLIRGSGPSRSVRRVKPPASGAEDGPWERDMLAIVLSPASHTSRTHAEFRRTAHQANPREDRPHPRRAYRDRVLVLGHAAPAHEGVRQADLP